MTDDRKVNVGRSKQCDIVLEDPSVSRLHARVRLSKKGYLEVEDLNSTNGTYLHRTGKWIRVSRVQLGRQDGVRFGTEEVALDDLAKVFGETVILRRQSRGPAGDRLLADMGEDREILENPRRNPFTGNVEERE